MNRKWLSVVTLLAAAILVAPAVNAADDTTPSVKSSYRLVMIPTVAQSWFDIVKGAAERTADALGTQLGTKIIVDYEPPARGDIGSQNQTLEQVVSTHPDGIFVDPVDIDASVSIIREAQNQGIPVVLYVAQSPEGSNIPYVTNDLGKQGLIEGQELLKRLGNKGKVAILQGLPNNSAHASRYKALTELFAQYPDIKVVDEAFTRDSIETAHTEAARILAAHPDLDGFAVVDAAGPVGVGLALQEADRVGQVKYVGIDDIPQLQELMKKGVLDLSISTKPRMMGEWSVLMLMMQNLGHPMPASIDSGIGLLTPDLLKDPKFEGF